MNNISHIRDCYGCGVCATVCPKKIISIRLNDEGFYVPKIFDIDSCINCGLCVDVCAFSHKELAPISKEIHSYAAWSKDSAVRYKCSSGGVGFEMGRTLLTQGYKVCGVKYNPERNRAEHYVATTVEELIPSIGSKYIQSYTVDGFNAISRKEKYLVTGTPCQIDSFRRYIQRFKIEDNFLLLDFFCHGVPSMLVWQKYIKNVAKTAGTGSNYSWRNKVTGWHDSWAVAIEKEYTPNIEAKNNFIYNSRLSQGDLFYKFFLGNMCLGKACYKNCKYKYNHSAADIRIGDLWGQTYQSNEEGVSAAIAFTKKGDEVLHQCNCHLTEHPFEVVAEGQIKSKLPMPKIRPQIIRRLQSDCSLEAISRYYDLRCLPKKIVALPGRIIRKTARLLYNGK